MVWLDGVEWCFICWIDVVVGLVQCQLGISHDELTWLGWRARPNLSRGRIFEDPMEWTCANGLPLMLCLCCHVHSAEPARTICLDDWGTTAVHELNAGGEPITCWSLDAPIYILGPSGLDRSWLSGGYLDGLFSFLGDVDWDP